MVLHIEQGHETVKCKGINLSTMIVTGYSALQMHLSIITIVMREQRNILNEYARNADALRNYVHQNDDNDSR